MVTWIWAVYARGVPLRAYNIGSEVAVDIATLARTVASAFPMPQPVEIRGLRQPGKSLDRSVPSTKRIREELGVVSRVDLVQGIARTIEFHRARTQPQR